MECVLCKVCKARAEILDKKHFAWFETQSNSVAIMEREADPQLVYQAHELLEIDPAACFKQYLALAEGGSVWSMANVGHMLANGTGVARDLARAEKWYLRAHGAGSDYALIWLGMLYQDSNRDARAQDVFRTGVERGFAPAMFYLAWSYWNSADWPQRRDETLTLLERGSAAGDLWARRLLANAMIRGSFGWQNIPTGIRLLGKLVEGEKATARGETEIRLTFLSRLAAKLWLAIGTKAGAGPKAGGAELLSARS
jgi:hypothetical protein